METPGRVEWSASGILHFDAVIAADETSNGWGSFISTSDGLVCHSGAPSVIPHRFFNVFCALAPMRGAPEYLCPCFKLNILHTVAFRCPGLLAFAVTI